MSETPSMTEVLARWAYETFDSHFSRHGLSWEDYKAADPGEAEHLYLSSAREQAQALTDAGFGHVASVEAEVQHFKGRQLARYGELGQMRARAKAAEATAAEAVRQMQAHADALRAAEARLARVRALLDGAPMVPQAQVRRALDGEATP